eukprot:TRINITY_DN18448_c0_g1_i1.p2 TRINITY_DN18448_c0_g1~~TRINITY_DN18448_c0_g1_i1.p2  ORF type:complete len:161 (-),score=46.32 TRINITY_DN18448_c0_g1_i1:111-593(-)
MQEEVRFFDAAFLDAVTAAARSNARQRQHLNLHAAHDEPVQRLFNAVEPGSYICPHRHALLPANENLFIVRGRLGVLIFDDAGAVSHARLLVAGGEACGAELAAGVWHTVVSMAPGTVMLEVKQGPFVPTRPEEFAPWAPEPGSEAAAQWLAQMETRLRD